MSLKMYRYSDAIKTLCIIFTVARPNNPHVI
jgi:hypothetical protein